MKYWKYWKPKKLHIEISAHFNSHKVKEQCILKATRNLQGSINTLHQSTFKPPKILKEK